MHQQLHVIRNTAHRPSTQASYTASRARPKRKISCAAAQIAATQIAATLTILFPRWRHMSLTAYWGQQRMSSTSYPGQKHRIPPGPSRLCKYSRWQADITLHTVEGQNTMKMKIIQYPNKMKNTLTNQSRHQYWQCYKSVLMSTLHASSWPYKEGNASREDMVEGYQNIKDQRSYDLNPSDFFLYLLQIWVYQQEDTLLNLWNGLILLTHWTIAFLIV